MMATEYVATIKVSYQISPDDWDVELISKKLTPDTTIKEIEEWLESKRTSWGNVIISKLS